MGKTHTRYNSQSLINEEIEMLDTVAILPVLEQMPKRIFTKVEITVLSE